MHWFLKLMISFSLVALNFMLIFQNELPKFNFNIMLFTIVWAAYIIKDYHNKNKHP